MPRQTAVLVGCCRDGVRRQLWRSHRGSVHVARGVPVVQQQLPGILLDPARKLVQPAPALRLGLRQRVPQPMLFADSRCLHCCCDVVFVERCDERVPDCLPTSVGGGVCDLRSLHFHVRDWSRAIVLAAVRYLLQCNVHRRFEWLLHRAAVRHRLRPLLREPRAAALHAVGDLQLG
jgi:hypothetical protein